MPDAREIIQQVGDSLAAFMNSGPKSDVYQDEIKRQVAKAVRDISVTVEQATTSYEAAGKAFLEKVIQVGGMPTRQISSDSQPGLANSSGGQIARNFDSLMPAIQVCLADCVKTYHLQAKRYFDHQLGELHSQLVKFLEQVPSGGTKDKAIKNQITEIKKQLRHLARWDKLFLVYKAKSLSSEIEYLFSLQENPLAVVWRYSQLDEQGEYQKTYDHKINEGRVYATRDNWAIKKGLMKAGADGYINDCVRPAHEVGCMCSLQWIYNLRSLPSDMITAKGVLELERVRAIVAIPTQQSVEKSASAAELNDKNLRRSWLARVFGRD